MTILEQLTPLLTEVELCEMILMDKLDLLETPTEGHPPYKTIQMIFPFFSAPQGIFYWFNIADRIAAYRTFTHHTPDGHLLEVTADTTGEEPRILCVVWNDEQVLPLLKQGYNQVLDDIDAKAWELMSS